MTHPPRLAPEFSFLRKGTTSILAWLGLNCYKDLLFFSRGKAIVNITQPSIVCALYKEMKCEIFISSIVVCCET
jgi:hypothetical protein